MDCPTCHSLNPDNALSCTMCGAVLIRREVATYQTAAEGPMIGTSYSAEPLATPMHLHARKATAFIVTAIILDAVLVALLLYPRAVAARLGAGESLLGANQAPMWLVIGVYAAFVAAWSIGKTGHAAGSGFWANFLISLVPPLIPAAMARIGNRSFLWTYVYLALDALAIAMAIHFFSFSPLVAVLVLIITIPFTAFHLAGCGSPQVAAAIGISPYLATIWLCGGPLALLLYGLVHTGMAESLVNSLVGDSGPPDVSSLRALVDPAIITGDYSAYCSFIFWCLGGWLFWLKSVYESLRYPMY